MSSASNGWTPERRAQQRLAIHRRQPWKRSTGPRSDEGKARVSRNAFKGAERPKLRAELRAFRLLLQRFDEVLRA